MLTGEGENFEAAAEKAKACHKDSSSKREFLKCMITDEEEEAVSELSFSKMKAMMKEKA